MLKAGSFPSVAPELLSPEQTALVRRHLEEILASSAFAGSKRTQDFLRLIVKHTLDGDIENLRERMIGAELFGRPVSYDTGSDSVVRVRASEVRKKLARYYIENREEHRPVCIELPAGSYVPRFHFQYLSPNHESNGTTPDVKEESLAHRESATVPHLENVPNSSKEANVSSWRVVAGVTAAAVILLALVSLVVMEWRDHAISGKGIRSIAVLPFDNLSGNPAQDYFADGMTEELINNLGQVANLRVISLTSSMSYKGTKKKLPEIARELNVDGVIEGGVLRDENQVRISAQLIDAHSDRPIWARTYLRDLTKLLSWQSELAEDIAQEISINVTPRGQAGWTHIHQVSSEAQDLYLHGILLRSEDDCEHATDYFKRAIQLDANYAQAHSALASCYGRMGESGRMPYEQAFTNQKAEAIRALELNDTLSEAHAELANTQMTLDRNWSTAATQFHRALELNPNSATNHEKYAFYLVRTGNTPAALAEIERSIDLDPVSGSTFHAEGFIYYFSRQYDRALSVAQTVQGLKINLPDWNFLLGDVYAEKGMYAESVAAFLKAGSGPYTLGHLGNTYAREGRYNEAMELISRLEVDVRRDGTGRYEIALVYAGLGQSREAFKWLEEAYQAHDVGLVYLKVDPCLDSLRSDPHFTNLMRRIGIPQ